jgi:hypothetical protein
MPDAATFAISGSGEVVCARAIAGEWTCWGALTPELGQDYERLTLGQSDGGCGVLDGLVSCWEGEQGDVHPYADDIDGLSGIVEIFERDGTLCWSTEAGSLECTGLVNYSDSSAEGHQALVGDQTVVILDADGLPLDIVTNEDQVPSVLPDVHLKAGSVGTGMVCGVGLGDSVRGWDSGGEVEPIVPDIGYKALFLRGRDFLCAESEEYGTFCHGDTRTFWWQP